MEKIIDMHTHTIYSDGDLTPNELITYAKMNGIKTLSITDHDTISGIKNLYRPIVKNIEFYPGIELTAKVNKGRMHILGYNIDINNKELNEKMEELNRNSLYSMMLYFSYLESHYGLSFSSSDIKNILNQERNIGRPDIAKLMINYGYSLTINDAFDNYLTPMYDNVRKEKTGISPEECISIIKKSGGIPVLAHPCSLKEDDYELLRTIKELKEYGLEGIEVYHSHHNKNQTCSYLDMANNLNLLVSGGSDYHGKSVKPDIEIGVGRNNLNIKELSLTKKYKSIY